MAQIPKGGLVKGPYKSTCRDCAIYSSTTVLYWVEDYEDTQLGGETALFFIYFYPDPNWEDYPILTNMFLKWVGSTTN